MQSTINYRALVFCFSRFSCFFFRERELASTRKTQLHKAQSHVVEPSRSAGLATTRRIIARCEFNVQCALASFELRASGAKVEEPWLARALPFFLSRSHSRARIAPTPYPFVLDLHRVLSSFTPTCTCTGARIQGSCALLRLFSSLSRFIPSVQSRGRRFFCRSRFCSLALAPTPTLRVRPALAVALDSTLCWTSADGVDASFLGRGSHPPPPSATASSRDTLILPESQSMTSVPRG